MIKVNINLLPSDIKEKQKSERFVVMAVMGMVAVVCILGTLYAFNVWRIGMAESQVTTLKEETDRMNTAIARLRVYEQKAKDVEKQKQILVSATSGKIAWSKILEQLMIVIPGDVALTSLSGTSDGITFNGTVLDSNDNPDTGHKPVANWLVKLSDINPQPDVWLVSSEKQGSAINFSNSAKFKKTPLPSAPPNTSGK